MKEITIRIETENAAFEDQEYEEVSRILQEIIDSNYLLKTKDKRKLYDINGNPVGELIIKEE